MGFLPEEYIAPVSNNINYTKLVQGETRLRIMSDAMPGWVYWNTAGKPVHSLDYPEDTSDARVDPRSGKLDTPKHVWAVAVWNYTEGVAQLWEITQVSIRNSITALIEDEDWGHPNGYDIKINREGTGLDTKYSVLPAAKKKVSADITKAMADAAVDLEAHFKPKEDEDPSQKIPF